MRGNDVVNFLLQIGYMLDGSSLFIERIRQFLFHPCAESYRNGSELLSLSIQGVIWVALPLKHPIPKQVNLQSLRDLLPSVLPILVLKYLY